MAIKTFRMSRILVINPNCSQDCSDGIEAAIAPFRFPGGPEIDVATLAEGPKAIYSWRDWHSVVEPLCHLVERTPADAFIVACASDPGIEAVRASTTTPVLGIFRCAVSAAIARADRFGVIALVNASKSRHLAALRALGLQDRLAGEIAVNVSLEALLDPHATRARLITVAKSLATEGAETVILGCTGMSHHRQAIEQAIGLPVIDPCQAAIGQALAVVLAG
jgi:Asp/Glu/hydantoin racemase